MAVGPFFYLNHPRVSKKGLLAASLPRAEAIRQDNRLVSPLSHQTLLADTTGEVDLCELPRGTVVYDEASGTSIVYIDRCIEAHIDEVVRFFGLTDWVIEYDDDYVCPHCEHLADKM